MTQNKRALFVLTPRHQAPTLSSPLDLQNFAANVLRGSGATRRIAIVLHVEPRPIDVAAILTAAYRRPDVEFDRIAEGVRARMALVETLGECIRLLVDVPASVALASLPLPEATVDKLSEEEAVSAGTEEGDGPDEESRG